ncbi:MAG: hypothetical protein L6266_00995 [Nanoarchaeota archaeon]|nr:hypothetical protein [Nanoarchaeota archaeon]
MTGMNIKKFYEGLRPEDRERVRLTVDKLKARGFEVYVAGSSLERVDYNDIDLVAKPREGMTKIDAVLSLDNVVESLKGRGASQSGDNINSLNRFSKFLLNYEPLRYVQSRITDRRKVSFSEDLALPQDTQTYVMSKVAKRKSLNLGKTKIDISVSYKPFELNPETKNIKL